MRRLRRLALLVAQHLYIGLVHVGSWSFSAEIGEQLRRAAGDGGSARGPAKSHPERLVPDQPLSEVERDIWRQLLR